MTLEDLGQTCNHRSLVCFEVSQDKIPVDSSALFSFDAAGLPGKASNVKLSKKITNQQCDMAPDAISDLDEFLIDISLHYRTIYCHFRIENRFSNLADHRVGSKSPHLPPPHP